MGSVPMFPMFQGRKKNRVDPIFKKQDLPRKFAGRFRDEVNVKCKKVIQ
jgi:hypothetical protein